MKHRFTTAQGSIENEEVSKYQKMSTVSTNNNTEYTRKYVNGVAEGDAFNRSSRSLAKA